MLSIRITGLDDLRAKFKNTEHIFEREIGLALKHSIAMSGTESQRRTPVDTGFLRSSIGGAGGYSYVRGLTAGIGTNVRYAIYVHEGNGTHKVGENKFFEKGLEASNEYIQSEFHKAMERLAEYIASK